MRSYREQDFEKMAERVVSQFLAGKAKLAEAAAEEAIASGLNPDQIERLSQTANTTAFLKMMDRQKQEGAPDLTQEFDPIDSRHVIKLVIDKDGVHVEPEEGSMGGGAAPDESMELPDQMGAMRRNPAEGQPGHTDTPEVMNCEEQCHEKHDPPNEVTEKRRDAKKKEAQVLRLRKLAAIYEDQLQQASLAFSDTFAKLDRVLEQHYRKTGNHAAYETLEKDASFEHNDQIGMAVLNALRDVRGLPGLPVDHRTKTAALADFHVSAETPELATFGALVKIAADAAEIRKNLEHVRASCL